MQSFSPSLLTKAFSKVNQKFAEGFKSILILKIQSVESDLQKKYKFSIDIHTIFDYMYI